MAGSAPDPHIVTEEGSRFRVQVAKGQNHGLFLDMAAGRAWVRAHVAAGGPRYKVLVYQAATSRTV